MTHVFVSYSRHDQEKVHEIVSTLEKSGLDVWWDKKIPVGEDYRAYIDKKLSEAVAICVVWSKNSVASRWVAEEAEEGVKRGNLIPIIIDDIEAPRGFRSFQSINIYGDFNDEYKLIDSIRKIVKSPKSDKPPGILHYASDATHIDVFNGHLAKRRTLILGILGTASSLLFILYDYIVDPSNTNSLFFRLGVLIPSFSIGTYLLYTIKNYWMNWIVSILTCWAITSVVYFQVKTLTHQDYGSEGLGPTINVVMVLIFCGVCMNNTNGSRAASLIGGSAIYLILAYLDGARSAMFWTSAPLFILVPSLFIWLGMYFRDIRG